MSHQTTLEIISDTEAYAVRGEARLLISGGNARYIIASYRHCLTHEGTGAMDAAHFLWGVIAGMQHQTLHLAQGTIERLRLRQIDEEAP
jgi:hypothetical protein